MWRGVSTNSITQGVLWPHWAGPHSVTQRTPGDPYPLRPPIDQSQSRSKVLLDGFGVSTARESAASEPRHAMTAPLGPRAAPEGLLEGPRSLIQHYQSS